MKNLLFLIMLWVLGMHNLYADDVQFTTNAPDVVVNGEQFRIAFTINSSNAKDFRAPSISDFDVLMGPKIGRASCRERVSSPV